MTTRPTTDGDTKAAIEHVTTLLNALGVHEQAIVRKAFESLTHRISEQEVELAQLREVLGEQRHIVEFREDGWGLQHPVECRPDLIGCEVNRAIQEEAEFIGAAPVEELGRYVVAMGKNGPDYRALTPTTQDQSESSGEG